MAEPTKLTTRIISKHITLEQANTGTWKPYEGEIVLARVETKQIATDTNGNVTVQYVPTYLMKVGAKDAEGNLIAIKDLQWTHAPASDVFAWAKQQKLAITTSGDGNVISNIEATDAGITITKTNVATTESITTINSAIEALQSAVALEATDRSTADTFLDNKITAINNNLNGATEGGIGARLGAVEGVASGAASTAAQNATNLTNYKEEMVQTLQGKVDVSAYNAKMSAIDTETADIRADFAAADADVKTELIGATGSTKDSNTIQGAKLYADSVAEAKAAVAQSAAEGTAAVALAAAKSELQGNINTLSGTVTANDSANSTAHSGFNTRIETLEQKVANVSTVMDFVGVGTATVTKDEETQEEVITITVEGVTSFQKGDVVATEDGKEFVYDGAKWHEFGYADDTEATVANLKTDFETFRNTTVPTTYATKNELTAETTARTTAIQEIDTAYKKAVADLKTELSGDINEANTDAYDRAVAEAARLDGVQTTAITTAYQKAISDAKTTIENAQAAIDAAQNTKITALETAVGDANSGLIKGLADEIARADAAEKANAAAIKNIQDTYVTKTDKESLEKATQDVADDLSELSQTVTANKQDVDTNFVKVVDGKATVGGSVIIFDCGGAEEA